MTREIKRRIGRGVKTVSSVMVVTREKPESRASGNLGSGVEAAWSESDSFSYLDLSQSQSARCFCKLNLVELTIVKGKWCSSFVGRETGCMRDQNTCDIFPFPH